MRRADALPLTPTLSHKGRGGIPSPASRQREGPIASGDGRVRGTLAGYD